MKPEKIQYLREVSKAGLEDIQFRNLSRAQGAQKQIQELLEQAVNNLVEAELARILRENKIPRVRQAQLPPAPSETHLPRGERPVSEDPFEPWFNTGQEAIRIRAKQTVAQQRRWTTYFDLWGCISCDRKENVRHASKGLCERCHTRIIYRLKQIDRNRRVR